MIQELQKERTGNTAIVRKFKTKNDYHKEKSEKGTIYFDYQGIEAWYTGEWQAKSEIALFYVKESKKFKAEFNFHKVKAHSGDRWNEEADALAKKGMEQSIAKK